MTLEKLGLIGNCQFSALIDTSGAIRWCCLPRFDSEPVFGSLLDSEGGVFQILGNSNEEGSQSYIENTNILTTTFTSSEGSFRVIDFAPRFKQFNRMFRPTQIVRIIEPMQGAPVIKTNCSPVLGWSKVPAKVTRGSNHLSFEGYDHSLRLTTDIPISYIDGTPFILNEKKYLVLSMGAPIEEALAPLCERFLSETEHHWKHWVKQCTIPADYQKEVIRSALVLKLHCFEDTGAIIAATTTSIPETPNTGRCWDYRYCWLRDSYYVLGAFRLLGLFEEREQFTNFLLGIVSSCEDLNLKPLYRIDGKSDLDEQIISNWAGYKNELPIRIGNGAANQVQNDIYGELVLCLTPIFFDERFASERTQSNFNLLYRLAKRAVEVSGTPDAGIWEYRTTKPTIQTFSTLMCWAAVDRLAAICEKLDDPNKALFQSAANIIREQIVAKAWSDSESSFVACYDGKTLDAALLQMPYLRFLGLEDPRVRSTVNTIRTQLMKNGLMMRYTHEDGLGYPASAFLICSFWLVEALAILGDRDSASALLKDILIRLPSSGLLSEDIDPDTGEMWGNFPQAYSHVGLIHAAFSASRRWSEVL